MPYMYRAVDTGLRAIDVRTLTEAGQSLGAGWGSILFDIILPNIRVAILSGAFLSFAIVIGELILAQYLAKPAFAPYMAYMIQQKAYEPAAMAIISFALTWAAMGIISAGRPRQRAGTGGGRTLNHPRVTTYDTSNPFKYLQTICRNYGGSRF